MFVFFEKFKNKFKINSLRILNKEKNSEKKDSIICGKWNFNDRNKQIHTLVITANLNIIIDQNKLDVTVIENNSNSIVFIDKFGYILKINLYHGRVISIYDEAEDVSFSLKLIK